SPRQGKRRGGHRCDPARRARAFMSEPPIDEVHGSGNVAVQYTPPGAGPPRPPAEGETAKAGGVSPASHGGSAPLGLCCRGVRRARGGRCRFALGSSARGKRKLKVRGED